MAEESVIGWAVGAASPSREPAGKGARPRVGRGGHAPPRRCWSTI